MPTIEELDPFKKKEDARPSLADVDPFKPRGTEIRSNETPLGFWESVGKFFEDPQKEAAKATIALVDSETLNIQPKEAFKHQEEIEKRKKEYLSYLANEKASQQYFVKPIKAVGKVLAKGYYKIPESLDQFIAWSGGMIKDTAESARFWSGRFFETSNIEAYEKLYQPNDDFLKFIAEMGKTAQKWGLDRAKINRQAMENPLFQITPEKRMRLWDNPLLVADPEWMISNIGDAAVSSIPPIVATIFGGPAAGMVAGGGMEGGDLYKNLIDAGVSDQDAALWAASFGVVVGILNQIGIDEILKGTSASSLITKIAKAAATGATEATTEYLEEPFQAAFDGLARGKTKDEIAEDVIESLKNVDVIPGSFIFGGGAAIVSTGEAAPEPTAEAKAKPPAAPQEPAAEPTARPAPAATIIGTNENEQGEPISFTMADQEGNTFDVPAIRVTDEESQTARYEADPEAVRRNLEEIAKEAEPVEEVDEAELDRLLEVDEADLEASIDAIIEKVAPEVEEAPTVEAQPSFEAFSATLEEVLPKEQADATTAILEARARAAGMSADEYIQSKGLVLRKEGITQQEANTLLQSVYHGTPHKFDKFTLEHIGTGEGAQAFGWGLYFAGGKEVAEYYRQKLSRPYDVLINGVKAENLFSWEIGTPDNIYLAIRALRNTGSIEKAADQLERSKQLGIKTQDDEAINKAISAKIWLDDNKQNIKIKKTGQLVEADIPEDDVLLRWDLPLSEQPIKVIEALRKSKFADDLFNLETDTDSPLDATGKDIYDSLHGMVGGFGETFKPHEIRSELSSKHLNQLGIKGIKYPAGTIAGAQREGNFNYVIFDDASIQILDVLEQGQGDVTKASVTFKSDSETIIRAFESADVSSMVHELGHVFRRDLAAEDLRIAEDFAGVKDGQWTTAAEEKFSRGFERYLSEGFAPTEALKNVFEKLKTWLTEIYRGIVGSQIDVKLTPEIKGVFDRLLSEQGEPITLFQKESVQTTIRRTTGQVKPPGKMITEREALKAALTKAAQAARVAFREGKKEGVIKQKQAMSSFIDRNNIIRTIKNSLNLTDEQIKKIGQKDIFQMTDEQFGQFLKDIDMRAVEFQNSPEAKRKLMQFIEQKRLKNVDNYRKALNLPVISKMTTEQLGQFLEALEPFQEGDVFLTQRQLETVDRTDLKGIMTWREAREKLAETLKIPVAELAGIEVGQLDSFRYDTALAEQNPFYEWMVGRMYRGLLTAEATVHDVETKLYELAKKSQKSRKLSLVERAIPQDRQIIGYLEAPIEEKNQWAAEMTPEQLDLAHFMYEYFGQALDYLINSKALERGRENYFVHLRKTFLETWKDDGFASAVSSVFTQQEQDRAVFNILDDDTGNILPLEKFFQFSLRRTGTLDPSSNIVRAFLIYATTFEKKKALDAMIPEFSIYSQALTPTKYTPRGLEVDRSLKKFVNKWVNNKKGRRISYDSVIRQGGKIDSILSAARTFTTLHDLGLNIPVHIATFIGEQVATFQEVGPKALAKGVTRLLTPKGRRIVAKYEAFVGRSAFEEFAAPGKNITERLSEGLFALFHQSTVQSNKEFLLSTMTDAEWKAEEISEDRLAELKIQMGRYRAVPGSASLVGSTSIGGIFKQYKSWAIPIARTLLIKNSETIIKTLKAKGPKEALTTKEAQEIYRFVGTTFTVLAVASLAGADDKDKSFLGKLKRKIISEATTLLQGIDPTLWLSVPRVLIWFEQMGEAIKALILLEEYEDGRLKGPEKLKKELIPSQLRGTKK